MPDCRLPPLVGDTAQTPEPHATIDIAGTPVLVEYDECEDLLQDLAWDTSNA